MFMFMFMFMFNKHKEDLVVIKMQLLMHSQSHTEELLLLPLLPHYCPSVAPAGYTPHHAEAQ